MPIQTNPFQFDPRTPLQKLQEEQIAQTGQSATITTSNASKNELKSGVLDKPVAPAPLFSPTGQVLNPGSLAGTSNIGFDGKPYTPQPAPSDSGSSNARALEENRKATAIAADTAARTKSDVANSALQTKKDLLNQTDLSHYNISDLVKIAKQQSPQNSSAIDEAVQNWQVGPGMAKDEGVRKYLSQFVTQPPMSPMPPQNVTGDLNSTENNGYGEAGSPQNPQTAPIQAPAPLQTADGNTGTIPTAPAPTPLGNLNNQSTIDPSLIGSGQLIGQSGADQVLSELEGLMSVGIDLEQKSYTDLVAQLKNQSELAKKSYDAAISQANADKAGALDVLKQQEDITLVSNKLTADESKAKDDTQLALANDNNSRLEGYLKGKLAAAGMLDGGEGLVLLGKSMGTAQLALNELEGSAQNGQKYYANQTRQIMLDYTKDVLKIGGEYNGAVQNLTKGLSDSILAANKDLITSEATKNKNIMAILKDFQTTKIEHEDKKSKQVLDLYKIKLDEAKFQHTVVQDAITQKNWEDTFGFDQYKFEANYGLDINKFNFDKDKFGMQYAMDQQKMVFDQADADRKFGLEGAKFGETQLQNDRSYNLDAGRFGLDQEKFGLEKDKFNQSTSESDRDYQLNQDKLDLEKTKALVDAGYGESVLNKYLKPEDIMQLGYYTSGKTTTGLSENLLETIQKVVQNPVKAGYECVQFVRDIVKDLPTGLKSLKDKISTLVESKYSIKAPEAGSVVVTNDGSYGHVAFVSSVSADGSSFNVKEFNYKKGQYSERTISTSDPKIEGYWKSPKIQGTAANKTANKPLYDKLALVTTKMSPKTKALKEEELQSFIDSGDSAGAENYVKKMAYDAMPADSQKQYNMFDNTQSGLKSYVGQIDANEGGVWKKIENDNRKWVDLAQDPKYRDTQAAVQLSLTSFVHEMYGANLTAGELERAKNFLPQPDDKGADIIAKIKNFNEFAKNQKDLILNRASGNFGDSSSSSGTIRVRTKDGQTGTIPASEFDSNKYTKI